MTYRVRNIGIAVALAVVAALMTSFYVTNYKRHIQSAEDHTTVYVAKQNIPAGTEGADAIGMLGTQQVPKRSVVPGAIADPSELKGRVAAQETYAGEQVTTRRFDTVSQSGVRGQLVGTLRAVSVQGDKDMTLAGTLKDGDHVDLVASIKGGNGSGGDTLYSRVVIRDMKVLQAPSGPAVGSKLTSGIDQKFSVMLAMTDNQAQKFQWILANREGSADGAGWHLALRPVVKDADSPDHVDTFYTVVTDGLSAYAKRLFRSTK